MKNMNLNKENDLDVILILKCHESKVSETILRNLLKCKAFHITSSTAVQGRVASIDIELVDKNDNIFRFSKKEILQRVNYNDIRKIKKAIDSKLPLWLAIPPEMLYGF